MVVEHIDIQGPDVYTNEGRKYIYALISEQTIDYLKEAIQLIKERNLMDQNNSITREFQEVALVDLKNAQKLIDAAPP